MARDRRSTNRFKMAERQGYDYSLIFIVLFLLAFGNDSFSLQVWDLR